MNLVKKLHFDGDVLDALRTAEWSDDGTSCKLPQLNRDLYLKVAKAFKAMNGKWVGGKTQATIFPADPRPLVEGLLINGFIEVPRDGFFETPDDIVERMIEWAGDLFGVILEPEAGKGAILKHIIKKVNYDLSEPGPVSTISAIEKNHERAEYTRDTYAQPDNPNILLEVWEEDFLEADPEEWEPFNFILMNPPFELEQDIDHVRHAYDFLAPGGTLVSIMSEGAFTHSSKKAEVFLMWFLAHRGQMQKLPPDSFKSSGTGVSTRMVKIVKGDA